MLNNIYSNLLPYAELTWDEIFFPAAAAHAGGVMCKNGDGHIMVEFLLKKKKIPTLTQELSV